MKLKVLAEGVYEIVGVMDGDSCPAEAFLTVGPADTAASRAGLVEMLNMVSDKGFQGVPSSAMKKISKALRQFVADAKKSDSYWVEATKLQFAMALEDRRRAAGMTYKALAEKIGASGAYISKVFRGDSNMTIESMVKLSRATGGHLVVRIVDSEADAHLMEPGAFTAKLAAGKPMVTTTEPSITLAMNDERFVFAA